MAIVKSYKIEIDGQQANATVGQIKNEVERLEEQLDGLELGSLEADKVLQELGRAKSALNDLDEATDAAFAKNKAGAFVDAVSGVAGAFEVATVAGTNFGLLSGESAEAYQKKLTEMIALVQGLESVHKLTTAEVRSALSGTLGSIKQTIAGYFGMGAAAQTSAGVTRAALISTGLGAFIVLLGVIIANWDKITAAVNRNRAEIKAFLSTIPLVGDLVAVLDQIEAKFGGISQLISGLKEAFLETFSVAGDVLGKLLQGDVRGALGEARKLGQRSSEAFDEGVRERNAELAEEREQEAAKLRQDSLKRQIAEEEAAGRDSYSLKKQQLQDELLLLDKSADDYQKLLADKQSEIRVLTLAHNKKLAEDAEKARKEEADKQKAASDKAQKDAEDRYAKLRAAQKEAAEQQAAANEEERKRRVALAKLGGGQQNILRAEIDAAKDAQTELMLNGKRFGSEWLALQSEIQEKEQQITQLNLAEQKRANDERQAGYDRALAALDDTQYERLSSLQRAGAGERQLDEQRRADLEAQIELYAQQGRTGTRAYVDLLNALSDLDKKLAPRALSLGEMLVKSIFNLSDAKAQEVAAAMGQVFGQVTEAAQMLNDVFFASALDKTQAQIDAYTAAMDAAKERSDQANQELQDAQQARKSLEDQLDAARGAKREYLLQQIARQRQAEALAAREKKAADAEELKNAKLKEDAEKRKQKLERESQILSAASATASNVATAAEATLAAVKAVRSGADKPWPANLIAIASALAAVGAAVASAKQLGNTLKGANGGLLEGPSHALGGIRGTAQFANVEVEGGEALTNRRATANNLDTLATINKYGARVQFVAVPKSLVKGATGGQFSADGSLDVATANGGGLASASAAQQERTVALLEQAVTYLAIVAEKDPFVFDGPTSKRITDRANQENADAGGGKLF